MRKLVVVAVSTLGLLAGCTAATQTPAPMPTSTPVVAVMPAPSTSAPANPTPFGTPTFVDDPAPEIPCIKATADMQVALGMGSGSPEGRAIAQQGGYDYIGLTRVPVAGNNPGEEWFMLAEINTQTSPDFMTNVLSPVKPNGNTTIMIDPDLGGSWDNIHWDSNRLATAHRAGDKAIYCANS